ncbi:hypothetical protein EDM00_08380 [Ornithobacterium rhinotracheale]|uniref:hypothetical protein n=1 Tax=Ornithobacterium rhinotracheale TaxID=28251 RepID=UPI00129C7CC2|nr:hypothetical protein [Ornithobacterium rhinotracheale]MRI64002.1 hypothetical protein [Ornithobacterium rhinotracheale]MRJ09390.1 hypothetical protein [Ornithobacterium rhinotracheale]UOH78735.1 hypothetical protein MT996_04500 [Ornithobacterium rhinotracheale]
MIHKILHLTYPQYDSYRDACFYQYCQQLSQVTAFTARELYKNDLMQNYFCDMWLAYIEKPFLRDNKPYLHLGEPDCLWSVLETYISTIYDEKGVKMYPSAILYEIKKQKKYEKKKLV